MERKRLTLMSCGFNPVNSTDLDLTSPNIPREEKLILLGELDSLANLSQEEITCQFAILYLYPKLVIIYREYCL